MRLTERVNPIESVLDQARQSPGTLAVASADFVMTYGDLASSLVDVTMQTNVLTLDELTLPSGSCPYLYAWDGSRFRFVTDLLGASPLGLSMFWASWSLALSWRLSSAITQAPA